MLLNRGGMLAGSSGSGVPDAYTPPDGTWNVTGDLDASGDLIATDLVVTGQVKSGDGSAAAPSYIFTGSTTTGMYERATNQIGFSCAGSEFMKISSLGVESNAGLGCGNNVASLYTNQLSNFEVNHIWADQSAVTYGGFFKNSMIETTGATAVANVGVHSEVLLGATNNQNWTDAASQRCFSAVANNTAGSTGTITGTAGYYVADGTFAGSTVTNQYGFYAAALTGGGTNYGVRIAGADVVFSGTQNVVASATVPTGFLFTAGAHTATTASTEVVDVLFDLSRTTQFATGAIGSHRSFKVLAPTLAAVGATTITHAATVYVNKAPVAGTNMTITNPYALFVDAGISRFDGPLSVSVGNASTCSISFMGDPNTGIFTANADELSISAGGTERVRFDDTGTASQTALMLYDVDNATLERVTVGAADSGGAGFKVLRIPN